MRDPPGRGDRKICRENTVVRITKIVSKFKRNILKDQCYQYRFSGRFGLSIGMEYFGTGLFWRTVLYYFGIAR